VARITPRSNQVAYLCSDEAHPKHDLLFTLPNVCSDSTCPAVRFDAP
jgi:hypothetical protein